LLNAASTKTAKYRVVDPLHHPIKSSNPGLAESSESCVVNSEAPATDTLERRQRATQKLSKAVQQLRMLALIDVI